MIGNYRYPRPLARVAAGAHPYPPAAARCNDLSGLGPRYASTLTAPAILPAGQVGPEHPNTEYPKRDGDNRVHPSNRKMIPPFPCTARRRGRGPRGYLALRIGY
jgi:hypothetical protein